MNYDRSKDQLSAKKESTSFLVTAQVVVVDQAT
jgi:hypothetical protein